MELNNEKNYPRNNNIRRYYKYISTGYNILVPYCCTITPELEFNVFPEFSHGDICF